MPESQLTAPFAGRSILVTGAASGIGAASVGWLARLGARRFVLVDRDEPGLAALAAALDTACETILFAGDVADPKMWDEAAGACCEGLDHAVLNAGIADAAMITELDFAQWRRVLATNLDGMVLSLQCALRAMRDGGSIVLTASASGFKAEPGTAAYGASKAGVLQLAKVAAKEAAARNIRVNAIAPGGVDTAIWDGMPMFEDLVREHGSREAALTVMASMATPLGRFARAEEIAAQIGFLLGDEAATITGATLVSDGGYSL